MLCMTYNSSNDKIKLHVAATKGNITTVNRLLREGVNPDANLYDYVHSRNNKTRFFNVHPTLPPGYDYFQTPLHTASAKGHTNVVNRLLRAGAMVDKRSGLSDTPLHLASSGGHLSVVNTLLKAGAPVDASGLGDRTPLHSASEKGHISVVNALLRAGARPNSKLIDGQTPLHTVLGSWLPTRTKIPIVKSLIKSGANPHLKTSGYNSIPREKSRTAFDMTGSNEIQNALNQWKRPERQTLAMKVLGNRVPPNVGRHILALSGLAYKPNINKRPNRVGQKRARPKSNTNTGHKQ